VRNDKQKVKAEKVTKKVKGVTSVVNELVISPLDCLRTLPSHDREGVVFAYYPREPHLAAVYVS
jgi:hypothetical protein